MNSVIHHAAELRRTHPLRPPPEPDSPMSHMLRLLVVMCFCIEFVDPSFNVTTYNHTHPIPLSYTSKMSTSNRDPPQAPIRGDRYYGLEGLTIGGNGVGDKTGIDGLSLNDDFDGECVSSCDQTKMEMMKKTNRRVSVDPDGSDASSLHLPSFSRTNSPRAKMAGGSSYTNSRLANPKDDVKTLLVEGLLNALGIDPSGVGNKSDDVKVPDVEEKKSYLPSGVKLRSKARTADSAGDTKVQITRRDRKNDGSSSQAKLRQRWCTSLNCEFASPDFSKIFGSDSTEDVASLAIGIQDSLKEFFKWCVATDTIDIFKVPVGVSDYSDLRRVSTASIKCLLTSYNDISLLEVKSFQAFINLNCDDCEGLSSEWCLDKLINSTEPTLRCRVLQSHDKLPPAQQGGIAYFKILADECYKETYQAQKSLKTWIESFDLRNFNGEDVRVATTTFKSVIDLLGPAAPDKYLKCFIRGMTNASCAEFQQTAKTQLGFYGTTPYEMWRQSFGSNERAELDSFGSTFITITSYNDHCQANEWSGFGHVASSFKASISSSAVKAAQMSEKRQVEKCTIPGCGGNHASNMHYKLESRLRNNINDEVSEGGLNDSTNDEADSTSEGAA